MTIIEEAKELLVELDSYNGIEYDDDCEIACQQAYVTIKKLLELLEVKTEIMIALGDDWSGLYKNGWLVTEGHSITADDIMHSLGSLHDIVYNRFEVDMNWLDGAGSFPNNLDEVKFL